MALMDDSLIAERFRSVERRIEDIEDEVKDVAVLKQLVANMVESWVAMRYALYSCGSGFVVAALIYAISNG
jgi:hypothetical protein